MMALARRYWFSDAEMRVPGLSDFPEWLP